MGLLNRYTTDTSYKEFEQMRVAMEPLTYAAGVDVFFYGNPSTSLHALSYHLRILCQSLTV